MYEMAYVMKESKETRLLRIIDNIEDLLSAINLRLKEEPDNKDLLEAQKETEDFLEKRKAHWNNFILNERTPEHLK